MKQKYRIINRTLELRFSLERPMFKYRGKAAQVVYKSPHHDHNPPTPPRFLNKESKSTNLTSADDYKEPTIPLRGKAAHYQRLYRKQIAAGQKTEESQEKILGTFKTKFEKSGQRSYKRVTERDHIDSLEITQPPKFKKDKYQ